MSKSNEKLRLNESIGVSMVRNRPIGEGLSLAGKWITEHFRKSIKIAEYYAFNDITTAAKNNLFDVYFNSGTQVTSTNWCGSLINNAGFTGYTPLTDTMATHPGWVEWTAYSQTARVPWGQGAASGASITNTTPMVFDITGTGTLRGLFIASNNTKGGTTGLLWSAASYTATVDVQPGDQMRSLYSLSA